MVITIANSEYDSFVHAYIEMNFEMYIMNNIMSVTMHRVMEAVCCTELIHYIIIHIYMQLAIVYTHAYAMHLFAIR